MKRALFSLGMVLWVPVFAAIQYSGIQNIELFPNSDDLPSSGFAFDVNGDLMVDYTIAGERNLSVSYLQLMPSAGASFDVVSASGTNWVNDAADGSLWNAAVPVSGTPDAYLFISRELTEDDGSGQGTTYGEYRSELFAADDQHFIGLSFDISGETHYGWMQVQINQNGLLRDRMTIIDWAYETNPNTGIVVGAIPEPGSLSLILVGGLALYFRRRFMG